MPHYQGLLTNLVRMVINGEVDVFSLSVRDLVEQVCRKLRDPDSPHDTDDASSQIVLCATIMRIKSRRLLPVEEDEEEVEDAEEAALLEEERIVRCLAEYEHFRAVADVLGEMAEESSRLLPRGVKEVPDAEEPAGISHVSLLSLVMALEEVLVDRDSEPLSIADEEYPSGAAMLHLRSTLSAGKRVAFDDIFPARASRLVIVVVFISLLELIRTGEVRLTERNGRIYIRKEEGVNGA